MPIQQPLFSACLNQIKEGVLIVDQEGNVEACNSAVEKMFGCYEAEIVQKPVYQIILPEQYHESFQRWISHHFERFSVEKTPQTFRFTARRSNQQQFPAVCSLVNLQPQGYNGFMMTIQDVTDQQLLEAHQDELETQLRREILMRHLAAVINESLDLHEILNTTTREVGHFFDVERVWLYRLFFDPKTNLFEDFVCTQYCANQKIEPVAAEEINFEKSMYRGMSREDFKVYGNKNLSKKLTNMTLEQRLDTASTLEGPVQSEAWQAAFTRAKVMAEKYKLASLLDVAVEYKGLPYGKIILIDSNGERQWTEDERVLVQFVADQLGGALAQSDLYASEQKARQEAETANRRKSEFLGMMSHELRTPLNAIIGFSRMIEKGMVGPINEKQASYIQNVGQCGEHLLQIVNDLLDVSQIEVGKIVLYTKIFKVQPVVDEVKGMLQMFAAQKQVQLQCHIQPGLETIEADPDRFRQILINLLNNAIKFNQDQGSVWLNLRMSEDRVWLIGEVKDTGIGIPKDKQCELFKHFSQIDAAIARQHEGTGLGLALTKDLLALHGGSISVESAPGEGATFTFRIPLHPDMSPEE